jgi:hypothetical protein
VLGAVLIGSIHFAYAGSFSDMVKGAQDILGSKGGLSNDEIIQGLKEPDIKIPLPESVQKVEKVLRATGYGEKVDSFELSMNRAAERAAPEAKSIFGDAITQMTFDDAKKILNGQDNEATLYFEDKTSARLQEVFKPIVKDAMGEVGVTQSFQDLNARAESMPFGKSLSFDLDQYVTDGALKGLFEMLAEEEKRIRTEPAARVTDLLKKVFANQ